MEWKQAEEETLPVSPIGKYFKSSVLSICILGILESEVPVDDLPAMSLLNGVFLPINPRFSSIMVTDQKRVKQWKRVEVKLEDHLKFPNFPPGMSSKFYDKCLEDYLSKISVELLPQSQPLWEVHGITYPTSNAAGTVIFKIHHSLGDGYSLMGALLSCMKRADDPSRPLTFPSVQTVGDNNNNGSYIFKNVTKYFSSVFCTASDFSWSTIKSHLIEDDVTPIRSGNTAVAWGPMAISTITFSLHQIKQIKAHLGVTINDVITGIIFLGTRLYMQSVNQESSKLCSTALVLLNTRMFRGYSSVKEMVKPEAKSPWGNHFAFLHVPLPKLTDVELENPLKIIRKVQEIIKRERSSFGVHLTAKLLEAMDKFRGPQAAARYVHGTLKNASMSITNMIEPMERMSLANRRIKGLYFMVSGAPQSLIVTIVSYMGYLRIAIGAEDGFIDS